MKCDHKNVWPLSELFYGFYCVDCHKTLVVKTVEDLELLHDSFKLAELRKYGGWQGIFFSFWRAQDLQASFQRNMARQLSGVRQQVRNYGMHFHPRK